MQLSETPIPITTATSGLFHTSMYNCLHPADARRGPTATAAANGGAAAAEKLRRSRRRTAAAAEAGRDRDPQGPPIRAPRAADCGDGLSTESVTVPSHDIRVTPRRHSEPESRYRPGDAAGPTAGPAPTGRLGPAVAEPSAVPTSANRCRRRAISERERRARSGPPDRPGRRAAARRGPWSRVEGRRSVSRARPPDRTASAPGESAGAESQRAGGGHLQMPGRLLPWPALSRLRPRGLRPACGLGTPVVPAVVAS